MFRKSIKSHVIPASQYRNAASMWLKSGINHNGDWVLWRFIFTDEDDDWTQARVKMNVVKFKVIKQYKSVINVIKCYNENKDLAWGPARL